MAKRHASSMSIMAELPSELILTEILTRLPARSAVRFKRVCKNWQSFLSTKQFDKKNVYHVTRGNPRTHQKLLLLDAKSGTFRRLDCKDPPEENSTRILFIPFETDSKGMLILGSLNGLVCVAIKKTYQIRFELLFWNPFTGAYKTLSKSSFCTFHNMYLDAFGFYSDSSNDYRLLHIVRVRRYSANRRGAFGAYIYSRRLDSWRQITSLENTNYFNWPTYQWSPATFCGQNLYFTVIKQTLRNSEGDKGCIIGFDVEWEKFREIQFPLAVSVDSNFNGSLVVIGGCIHLCVAYQEIEKKFFMPIRGLDLWRMDGDGDSWMKMVAYSDDSHIPFTLTPTCRERNGNEDVTWVFNKAIFKIHSMTHVQKYLFVNRKWYQMLRVIYIETLISPNP